MEQWHLIKRLAKGVLRRRKRLAVAAFLGAAALLVPAAWYLSKEPPRYRATATVLLEARPDRVPVFQEFSPFRPLPVQLAILRSRSLAESVLESLPRSTVEDLLERPYHFDWALELQNAYRRIRGQEPEVESPQRRALKELQQGRMRFDSKGDGIVEISAEASRPQAAVDIVNTYVEVLLARTRSFNIEDSRASREFLEQQLSDVKKSLRASEEGLRAFLAAHGGIRIPDQHQETVRQLAQAETALAEIESSRKMLEARLAALRERAATQRRPPAAVPAAAPGAPPTPPEVQRLRAQLVQLETSLLDLQTRFTDEHPRVALVRSRIAEVRRQLGDAVKETTPPPAPTAVPPAERVGFTDQLVALETSLHTLSAQEEALRRQAETLRRNLGTLSRSEQEYTRLVREVESQRNLHALLSDKLTAARIREQGEMKVVKIIDPAGPALPVASEKRFRLLALALVLAAVAGAGVPATVEWVHRAVETEDDAEAATGLPVLAVLPRVRSRQPRLLSPAETRRLRRVDEHFIFSEAVRNLRVTLQLALRTDRVRSLLVVSPYANEGKSTVVLNLGLAFAEAGVRVVLADTDFQRPTLHKALNVSPAAGLADALGADSDVGQALHPVSDRLWVAPRGGALAPRARGALATGRLKALLEDISGQADLVLCDSSPVLLVPDNLFLAGAVDGVVLVARAGVTTRRDLARAKALLDAAGARLVGVVINEMPVAELRRHYERYYRSYLSKEPA